MKNIFKGVDGVTVTVEFESLGHRTLRQFYKTDAMGAVRATVETRYYSSTLRIKVSFDLKLKNQ